MKLITMMALLGAATVCAQTSELPLMPWPAKVALGENRFPITETFAIHVTAKPNARVERAVARTLDRLTAKTGIRLPAPATPRQILELSYTRESPHYPQLGDDESYRLSVTANGARIDAPTDLGVLHGLATFAQLVAADQQGFAAPAVTIEDRPRFPWRGLLLDVARHWMPAPVVKRTLDGMAAVKMNVLHLHLSDDQGFRVESKRLPKLQGQGSDGVYFTQEQLRDIIDYAAERGIRVIPEFDMPGHTTSWLVGYPEIASLPGPYTIERKWGIFDPTLDPSREETYRFLDTFIGEMAALFPDAYFHIGGDEVNGKQWSASQRVKDFKQTHAMKDNHDFHAYFNQRLIKIVTGHGKRMIGWDDVLHPDLPKDAIVQSWRGQKSLAEAAQQGYQSILSAGYYLDLIHSAARHYGVDPLEGETAGLNTVERQRVLGGESCMWVEYASAETVDSRIWPRNAAIAERLWSPQTVKDLPSMYRRLAAVSSDLEHVGLTHRSGYRMMLERIAGSREIGPLMTLVDVVEPPKGYARGVLNSYTSLTPLNRLVDAARPESDTAREFSNLVGAYLASRSAADADSLRRWLVTWRDNDAAVQAMLGRSFLMAEAGPVSAELKVVAGIGFDALAGGKDAAWRASSLDRLKTAERPLSEVLIMVVPHIRRLVEALPAQ